MRSILGGTRCATSASATRLAMRARGAGAAGQDQVVDELALSNLIYGRSINQDFFAAAPRGRCRLFLLPLQFMFDGAGGAGDDGHCDKEARGRHLAVRCSLRLHGTRTSSRGKVLSRYGARAAWPECGDHALRPARPSRGRLSRARSAISAADMSDCAEFSGFRRMARLSAGQIRSMGNIRQSDADFRGETLTLV